MFPTLAPELDIPINLLLSCAGAQNAQKDETEGQKAPCAAPVKNKQTNNAL
jgi:hypothetical protein